VTQRQRLQPIVPIIAGIIAGFALFFIGKAMKDHFELNAAICNTFNGTSAGCAGNEFAFDMGGVVEYLGIFLAAAGLLGGLALAVSRSQPRPAAGTRPVSSAAPAPQPRVSHPPAPGVPARPAPTGPGSPSMAVPAAWHSDAPASSPALPPQLAAPPQSAPDPGLPAGQ